MHFDKIYRSITAALFACNGTVQCVFGRSGGEKCLAVYVQNGWQPESC